MSARFDFIIVGNTAAEAALAALLANDGHAVLLTGAGGLQPVVRCGNAWHDTLPPQWAGVRDGPYAQIAARLGVYLPVARRDPAWRLHLAQRVIDVPSDPGQWRRLRRALFPAQADAASRFWQAQETAAAAALRLAERFDPLAQLQVLRQQRLTAGDMLRRYGIVDPALRNVVDTILAASGLPASDHCPWPAGSVALLPPAEIVAGDAATLMRLFTDALIRAGGEWRPKQRAVALITTPIRVAGVRLAGGEEAFARAIVLGPAAWRLAARAGVRSSLIATGYLAVERSCLPADTPLYQIVAGSALPVTISLSPAIETDMHRRVTVAMRLSSAEAAQLIHAAPHERRQLRQAFGAVLQAAVATALPSLANGKLAGLTTALLRDPTVPPARLPAAQAGLWLLRPAPWLPPGYDNGSSVVSLYRQLRGLVA
ncbi:hypothetical protein A6A03_10245 [Chloroflexus islandicus]|uniref:FAD-dependent oxidoreductase n=1 Tax=Chloroflexus islandicus TaxID=1707952 RepID=A0A178MFD7_9CHLR|nr:hypothetical protein [Chloroflexus islandicus]OAN47449.1 hypothetical protein A6A03_10245 [Chloroflexus islandicus]